jgi:hypothetical protein
MVDRMYWHIKYCEPQTDISCMNAVYRRMTPRDVPHMTRETAWDHLQAMLGVDKFFLKSTMVTHTQYFEFCN